MKKSRNVICGIAAAALLLASRFAFADIVVPMSLVDEKGQGKPIGTITVTEQACGILLLPKLHDLPPGVHGFHLHENPSCANKAIAAGGHFDPAMTSQHHGPYSDKGHLGDMPVLIVNADGKATLPMYAPNIKVSSLPNHALVIHAGSDNYSDQPEKLGGGGARIACGVIGAS